MVNGLFAGSPTWAVATLAIAIALVVAYLAADVAARLARIVFVRLVQGSAGPALAAPLVRRPIRLVKVTMFVALAVVLGFPALKLAGFHVRYGFEPEAVVAWLVGSGVRVAVVAIFAWLVIRITGTAMARFVDEIARGEDRDALERAKRVRTLGTLIENTVAVVVVACAVLMALRELGIDILPLLTGAGIAGLAIGFGAQTLVKDVISGFFLILENQVRVGDVVSINGTGGLVEAIRLRTLTLRDLHGTVHVFPNGSITTLSNLSKDFSFAVLDVGVAYKEDTDRVAEVLRRVGAELQEDAEFAPIILEPLEVLGVDQFGDSAVVIRVRMKTLPLKQWAVGRELRRRIKKAFDREGIEIPFPHRTVFVRHEGGSRTGAALDAGAMG
jgi:small conductance mechanosensitive channel